MNLINWEQDQQDAIILKKCRGFGTRAQLDVVYNKEGVLYR